MIKREWYLNELIKNMHSGFPKVITGIRRCGKSYLLSNIFKDYLLSQKVSKNNILFINLDDIQNAMYRDPLVLDAYIRNFVRKKTMVYVMIDEIQRVFSIVNPILTNGNHVLAKKDDREIISFVDVILGLSLEKNIDLYVTGSNSKMLSTDIITEFRDKAINIHLSPLSFYEYSQYMENSSLDTLYSYMQYGGMPLCVLKEHDEDKRSYLKSLFELTYFKDILEHHDLKKSESLNELCTFLSSSTGELINSKKIADTYLSVKKEKIDKSTIDAYIQYFLDAFILNEAKRYDVKGRKEIGALRKYYFVDSGLRNAWLNFAFNDEGHILENVIYNELLYQGYTVNIGSFDSITKNKEGKSIRKTNEIDFYAHKENQEFYVQVTADLNELQVSSREVRAYKLLKDSIPKIIVVNKPIHHYKDEHGFIVMSAIEFMLNYIA